MVLFEDRQDAGRQLVAELSEYRGSDGIVLALPRGGVAVGYEVATALELPLEVFISRKIGAPGNPELAVGAVAEVDGLWVDREATLILGVTEQYVQEEAERQRREIDRRIQKYRHGRPLPPLSGKTVIVVDDGIATGYTMLAALSGVRLAKPRALVAAVPVAPQESLSRLSEEADRVVCLYAPDPFYAVGLHYGRFDQVTDEEVAQYMERTAEQTRAGGPGRT